jgi:hypothetical protein
LFALERAVFSRSSNAILSDLRLFTFVLCTLSSGVLELIKVIKIEMNI